MPTRLNSSVGLWLPANRSWQSSQPQPQGFVEFVHIALSYKDLLGETPSWQKLLDVLEPYSLEHIVDVVCRINAALYSAASSTVPEVQSRICHGLFGEETEKVLAAADRLGQKVKGQGNRATIQLFYGIQTLALLKAAFLLKPLSTPNETTNNVGIGKALLMITDLINEDLGNLLHTQPSDPDSEYQWLQYFLVNTLSSDGSLGQKAFARAYDLYLTDKPALRDCGSYVDLPARVRDVTGLDPEALWAVLFALATHWANIAIEEVGQAAMAINRRSYFSTHFYFSPEEVDSFFALVATDAVTLQAQIQKEYTFATIKPFHVLSFARWPLVTFGERVYSVSVRLLMEKLTRGLHHLYLNNKFSRRQRHVYLTYIGKVFEDYVERICTRMYPPSSGRYISFDKLPIHPLRQKKKYCDGLILYEDAVILIEAKASLLTVEERSGLNLAEIKKSLQDMYGHAAEQIQETISGIRTGVFTNEGINPQRIRQFYPLVVTLESIPMTPLICAELEKLPPIQQLLTDDEVKPLQFMDVGCLEELEAIVAGGGTLKQLLDEKLSSSTEAEDSFANFLYRRRERWSDRRNKFLSEQFRAISQEAQEFFTNRQLHAENEMLPEEDHR
jgi:hypothetical protein